MLAKIHLYLDKIQPFYCFLLFFRKKLRFFLLIPKKGVPLHPQIQICITKVST